MFERTGACWCTHRVQSRCRDPARTENRRNLNRGLEGHAWCCTVPNWLNKSKSVLVDLPLRSARGLKQNWTLTLAEPEPFKIG